LTTEIPYPPSKSNTLPPVGSFTWPKILTPSLSDLFFLVMAVWLFMVSPVGWSRTLLDADTWFHTRIGHILLANGAVPQVDLFSFSKVAQPWYAFEWLSEVILATAYQIAGLKGIALFAAVMITLYLTVLLKYSLWKGANGLIALLLTLITATGTSIHYHARPHLFTLLFLCTAFWILDYNRRIHDGETKPIESKPIETKPIGRYLVWALVPLTILWVNLHGGFFIFFAMLGLRTAAVAAEAFFYKDLRPARRNEAIQLTILGLICSAVSLCNPYGIRLHQHILEFLSNPWVVANVSEFQAPKFGTEEMYNVMLLLFAGLAIVSSLLRQRNITAASAILFLAYASLTSVRHVTLFMLVATPILAVEFTTLWDQLRAGRKKSSILAILHDVSLSLTAIMPGTSLFIPLAVLAIAFAPGLRWPTEIPEGAVPVKFIEKHADRLATSRVFTEDQIADYLIFRNYPRQRVFFDSRHNYYGNELGNEFLSISNGHNRWQQLLDKWKFDLILVPLDTPLTSLLRLAGGWHVLDKGDQYILYERDKAL
jgi:hypothetical protein